MAIVVFDRDDTVRAGEWWFGPPYTPEQLDNIDMYLNYAKNPAVGFEDNCRCCLLRIATELAEEVKNTIHRESLVASQGEI